MNAVGVSHLSKVYQGRAVVDDVSFSVGSGSIVGLLGSNGAGKSTTLRMMINLTRPTGGHVSFFGQSYSSLTNPCRLVGSMLDAQANHQGRTGREILKLHAAMLGLRHVRAEELLDTVGLSGAGGKTFGRYSLGMRQRLGLACALIGDPSVLILDEPANGLDPQGVLWIRTLLREFAERGGAVLLSSHLLREVELLADTIVVLVNGRKTADLSRSEIAAMGVVRAVAQDHLAMRRALEQASFRHEVAPGGVFHIQSTADEVGLLAAREGIALRELGVPHEAVLESLFLPAPSAGSTDEEVTHEHAHRR